LSISADEDRGGRWVAAQIVLMVLIVVAAFLPPGWGPLRTLTAALAIVVGFPGLLLLVWAWRSLGPAATPYPVPREEGRLVVSGPYAFIRHPVYAGGCLVLLGLALATSPVALAPLAALGLLWRNKAALEEELLAQRYEDYREYRARVRGAFVPRRLSGGSTV